MTFLIGKSNLHKIFVYCPFRVMGGAMFIYAILTFIVVSLSDDKGEKDIPRLIFVLLKWFWRRNSAKPSTSIS